LTTRHKGRIHYRVYLFAAPRQPIGPPMDAAFGHRHLLAQGLGRPSVCFRPQIWDSTANSVVGGSRSFIARRNGSRKS
ncbi:MAG: hypothetical protein KJO02_07880, partial [Erythrobacter sp.]|nr:hypothetical protein [Erythrobacter sp.]